jgi:hypothetical protein
MQKSNSRDGDDGSLGPLACGCGGAAATVHKRDDLSTRELHKIWTEQCEVVQDIRLRYAAARRRRTSLCNKAT